MSNILDLLQKLPMDRRLLLKGDSAWICCPYHAGGMEKTPSMSVPIKNDSKFKNRFYCFACNKKAHWNDLADIYHLPKISGYKSKGESDFNFDSFKETSSDVYIFDNSFPWGKHVEWRGIDGKVVSEYGGLVFMRNDEQRLFLPVNMFGEMVGGITALTRNPDRDNSGKKTELSYVNSKGNWRNTSFFGYDIAAKQKGPLVLVEGPRDTLQCYSAGMRVVGTLGSSFAETRKELLNIMSNRPSYLILMFDNDEAGNKIAEEVIDLCSDDFRCVHVMLKKNKDPCDYTLDELRQLYKKVRKKYD
jgi:5S rRNA maturation endonuclease (ribonuclease M5)